MAEFDGELHMKYTPATQPGEKTVVSVEEREAAEAARDAAQAARDQALAAVETFTAPADSVIGALVGDGVSATALAVTAQVAAGITGKADADSGLIHGTDGKTYAIVACALRNGGAPDYWQPLNDAGHSPVNVASVTTSTTEIVVNFALTGAKVIASAVTVDETLAAKGYSAGASVALASATILLSRDRISDYVSYNGSAWVAAGGNMTFESYTAGVLRMTHAPIAGLGAQVSERDTVYRAQLGGMTPTRTEIIFTTAGGVKQTTPLTDFKAWVSRLGDGAIDPQPVPPVGHNLWLFVLLEV